MSFTSLQERARSWCSSYGLGFLAHCKWWWKLEMNHTRDSAREIRLASTVNLTQLKLSEGVLTEGLTQADCLAGMLRRHFPDGWLMSKCPAHCAQCISRQSPRLDQKGIWAEWGSKPASNVPPLLLQFLLELLPWLESINQIKSFLPWVAFDQNIYHRSREQISTEIATSSGVVAMTG